MCAQKPLKFLSLLFQTVSTYSNEGIDVTEPLLHGNFMNLLIFGRVYEKNDDTWIWLRSLLIKGVKVIGVAGPLNFLPSLRF